MTREELERILKLQLVRRLEANKSTDQDRLEAILDAMVAAYNKAIQDALELYYNPTSEGEQDTFDKDLESLKIQ